MSVCGGLLDSLVIGLRFKEFAESGDAVGEGAQEVRDRYARKLVAWRPMDAGIGKLRQASLL
jgi:hypothetical protein